MFEKKQTGAESRDDKDKTSIPEQKEAKEERKRGGAMKMEEAEDGKGMEPAEGERKRGGGMRRKHGGHVEGKMSMHRPDKRARGGGVGADLHPETAAGKMSENDYVRGRRSNRDEEGAGRGADKNAKGMG